MRFKKLMIFAMSLALSGILNTTLVLAAEVHRSPLTNNEISVLQQLGGNEIQSLVRGESVNVSKVKDALTNLSDEERQAVLSVTPEQLDDIIAGAMEAGDILLAALAAVGILFIVLVIAAN